MLESRALRCFHVGFVAGSIPMCMTFRVHVLVIEFHISVTMRANSICHGSQVLGCHIFTLFVHESNVCDAVLLYDVAARLK